LVERDLVDFVPFFGVSLFRFRGGRI
jgi:hypothetical protein